MCWRKVAFLIVLTTIGSLSASAEEWYSGSIYLKNDQVLKGKVLLKPEYDVVFFKLGDEEEVAVFPAYKIHVLNLFDPIEKATRKFVSLHVGVGAKSFYQFYEIVVDGAVSVFRRQHTMWYSIHLDAVDFDYFILYQDELFSSHRFKRKIYPQLEKKHRSLPKYVAENDLNLSRLRDVLKAIEFYNDEALASQPVASNQDH
jgi:hypothetical protein